MSSQSQNTILRAAEGTDVAAITALVNHFARIGLMLPRSMEQIEATIGEFVVAYDSDGTLLGCAALRQMTGDLAEIRSLAVSEQAQGRGIGAALVQAVVDEAERRALGRIFALTYQQVFFEKQGFTLCDRALFPEKVWLDCRNCPKQHCCDELAVMRVLDGAREETTGARIDPRLIPLTALSNAAA